MITIIEKAKSNRSVCFKCKDQIAKGDWRGVEPVINMTRRGAFKGNKFYCKRDTKAKILSDKIEMENWLTELEL